ncbi:MAG: hypothetical protein OEZ02_00345 [Anaerolineae bacterium]|nr:hypothetical protein [Anaerolineae bacterium]
MKPTNKTTIIVLILFTLMVLPALACKAAGSIEPSAEATRLAAPSVTPTSEGNSKGIYKVDDEVTIVGGSYGALVPLYGNPGDRFFSSQVLAGTDVVVIAIRTQGDVVWYEVSGNAGNGWLKEENLVPRAPEVEE